MRGSDWRTSFVRMKRNKCFDNRESLQLNVIDDFCCWIPERNLKCPPDTSESLLSRDLHRERAMEG